MFTDDNTMGEGFNEYHAVLGEAFRKVGRVPATGALLQQRLEAAGFVDIQVSSFKQPFGSWPKDQRMKAISTMFLLACETGMEAYGIRIATPIHIYNRIPVLNSHNSRHGTLHPQPRFKPGRSH